MPKRITLKSIIQQDCGTSKLGVALRILGFAPKVGEKGVAPKVGKKAASHLTPLRCTPLFSVNIVIRDHYTSLAAR